MASEIQRLRKLLAKPGSSSTRSLPTRLGAGWSALLPGTLAREALTPQPVSEAGGGRAGLGWFISSRGDIAMHGGAIPGSIASLLIRVRDNQVQVTMTNRQVPIDRIDDRVLRSWTRSNEESGAE